jgi:hypothetical protein
LITDSSAQNSPTNTIDAASSRSGQRPDASRVEPPALASPSPAPEGASEAADRTAGAGRLGSSIVTPTPGPRSERRAACDREKAAALARQALVTSGEVGMKPLAANVLELQAAAGSLRTRASRLPPKAT